MKQPANPFQRSLQKLKHQLSNGLNRAAKITPVHDRTDIPPRGCPAKIHPPIMSNLIHIPLKITATPNLLWRSPATKHTKQLPFTVDRYKTITVKTSFPGGSPPVPPTNFSRKKTLPRTITEVGPPGRPFFGSNFVLRLLCSCETGGTNEYFSADLADPG